MGQVQVWGSFPYPAPHLRVGLILTLIPTLISIYNPPYPPLIGWVLVPMIKMSSPLFRPIHKRVSYTYPSNFRPCHKALFPLKL